MRVQAFSAALAEEAATGQLQLAAVTRFVCSTGEDLTRLNRSAQDCSNQGRRLQLKERDGALRQSRDRCGMAVQSVYSIDRSRKPRRGAMLSATETGAMTGLLPELCELDSRSAFHRRRRELSTAA